MPRIFTPDELNSLSGSAYAALSTEDKAEFDRALIQLWCDNYTEQSVRELSRDLEWADANNRYGDLGA